MKMGIEIEIPNVTTHLCQHVRDVSGINFTYSDDGSIRQIPYTVENIPVLPMRRRNRKDISISGVRSSPEYRVGLELISPPTEYDVLRDGCKRAANVLGYIPPFGDASVHVHMDMRDKPWTMIQNIVHWFAKLEAILYRLSALGIQHRGERNDYRFMRPLTMPMGTYLDGDQEYDDEDEDTEEEEDSDTFPVFTSRPPVSPSVQRWLDQIERRTPPRRNTDERIAPVLSFKKMIAATSASEFFSYWGRMDIYWQRLGHYVPHRLHGINIVPMMTIGTVELRIFNGVYSYLPEILDICRGLYQLAENIDPNGSEDFYPLGSQPTISQQAVEILLDCDLSRLWKRTQWCAAPNKENLLSHYSPWHMPDGKQQKIFQLCPNYEDYSGERILDTGESNFIVYRN